MGKFINICKLIYIQNYWAKDSKLKLEHISKEIKMLHIKISGIQ